MLKNRLLLLSDIDECSRIAPPNCGEAVCVNTPGGYSCQCEPGYNFNDKLKTCEGQY